MKALLAWTGAGFGLLAATLWLWASYQKIDFDSEERDAQGMYSLAMTEQIGKRKIDILKTAAAQTKWNARAALAASAAALCQGILLALP